MFKSSTAPLTRAFNLIEVLVSLIILGVLVSLSMQLIRPENSLDAAGKKVGMYTEHLAMTYHRLKSQYGVTPLNVDFNGDSTPDNAGIPLFIRNNDTQAQYNSASPEYLQYPGDIRVYLRPEQFGFMSTALAELTGAGHHQRETVLVDIDPQSLPGSLNDDDVVLFVIDDATGRIMTGNEMAVDESLSTSALPASFYDTYKAS